MSGLQASWLSVFSPHRVLTSFFSHGDVNMLGMLSCGTCIAVNRALGKALPRRSRSPHLSVPTKQLHRHFVVSN